MAGGSACPTLLRYRQAVDLNFEEMVDADAVDAVDLGHSSALRFGVHDYAIDYEINLVGADAHFEGIDGFSVGLRFLNRVVGRLRRYGSGRFAVAAFDQPCTVLRHHKVQIALLRTFDTAAAEHQTVVVGVAARLHQRKHALDSISARRGIRRI